MPSSGINRELLTVALLEVAFKTGPDNAKNATFPRPVRDCTLDVWMRVSPSCLGWIVDEIAANLAKDGSFSTPQITNNVLRALAPAESVCDSAGRAVLVVKNQGQCATSALRNAGELKFQTGASIVCGIPSMVVFVEFSSLLCSLLPQQRTPPKNRSPCRVRSQIHHVVYLYNPLRRKPRALGNGQEAKSLGTWPLPQTVRADCLPGTATPRSAAAPSLSAPPDAAARRCCRRSGPRRRPACRAATRADSPAASAPGRPGAGHP